MYQASSQSRRHSSGTSNGVCVGAYPSDEIDDRRLLAARNPGRDYTRRQRKPAPAFQEPTWGAPRSRKVGSESPSSSRVSPTGGARRLTPEFKLPSQTRSTHAARPSNPPRPAMTSRVSPGAWPVDGPKSIPEERDGWVQPECAAPVPRKSQVARFFRALCCCC